MRRTTLLFVALSVPITRPTIEIRGFHMVESKGAERSIEVWADLARVFKSENLMVFDQMVADVWTQDQESPYRVSGQIGILKSETEDFVIEGDSRILSPDAYEFFTKNIRFNSQNRHLETSEKVLGAPQEKSEDGFRISGQGMDIDTREGSYRVLSAVQAIQKMGNSSNQLTIHSEQALFSRIQNNSKFEKKVTVSSKDLAMKGDLLTVQFSERVAGSPLRAESLYLEPSKTPDKESKGRIEADIRNLKIQSRGMRAQFNEKGEFTESEAIGQAEGVTQDGIKLFAEKLRSKQKAGVTVIELSEQVRIQTPDKDATCDNAEFFPDSGEVILNGIASVKKEDQLIQGERIRFSTKNSEIHVEKARGTMDKGQLLQE